MKKEFLVSASTPSRAAKLCETAIRSYVNRRSWRYVITPEIKKYEGRNKALNGKWRCYARIELTK